MKCPKCSGQLADLLVKFETEVDGFTLVLETGSMQCPQCLIVLTAENGKGLKLCQRAAGKPD